MKHILIALIAVVGIAAPASAQQVTKETRDGIKNFSRLETTVACAGAITSEAMPEIKKMGFVSVINLREAQEAGADIEKHRAAAEAAGLRYYHVPFNSAKPDPKVGRSVREDHLVEGSVTRFHSLRERQPRLGDVDDQAHRRRPLGGRARRGRSGGDGPDERRAEAVGD